MAEANVSGGRPRRLTYGRVNFYGTLRLRRRLRQTDEHSPCRQDQNRICRRCFHLLVPNPLSIGVAEALHFLEPMIRIAKAIELYTHPVHD